MEKTNHTCYIDGKPYSLSDVEKMGLKNFQFSAHIHPYHSMQFSVLYKRNMKNLKIVFQNLGLRAFLLLHF